MRLGDAITLGTGGAEGYEPGRVGSEVENWGERVKGGHDMEVGREEQKGGE